MARKIQDVELDIAEVKTLIFTVKRPSNQAALAKHLSALKSELQALTPTKVQQVPKVVPVEVEKTLNILWTPLKKYSWDQQGKKVKIYISLQKIGDECTANQIDVKFEKQALEVKIIGYRKINYLLGFKKLFAPIEIETCKYLVKTNMLSITLTKKEDKKWSQLEYKEDSFSKKDSEPKAEDPQASLMNMMKKMYQQGDDNMKRTIAQAWTKSQDKKGMGDMGGMGGLGGMGGMGGLGGMGGFGDM